MPRQSSHLLFLCISLMISLLPLRVQAALPKELPASPPKFLTGACLTRSEDLWITAEAGDIGNVLNRRLRRFGNSRRIFAADVGFRGKTSAQTEEQYSIHATAALPRRPVTGGRERSQPDISASYHITPQHGTPASGRHEDSSRQAPGRKSAVEQEGLSSAFPLHFRHFPLAFFLGVWYNKVVIPQTLHQQRREKAERK